MIGGLILWRKIYKKVITIVFLSLKLEYERSLTMTYNIIDIVDKNLTDTELKEIFNKKLYKIIELLEFNVNYKLWLDSLFSKMIGGVYFV